MVEKPGIAMASKLRLGVRGRWPLGPERTWRTRDLTQQLVPGLPWNGLLQARSGNMKKLPVAYAKSSEVAIAHGPAKVYSVQAQMVLNFFRENFDLCHEIVQQQLEVLRDQREEEKRFNWRLLEKTSDVDAVVLCKRMSEVQVSARARVVAELLYLKVAGENVRCGCRCSLQKDERSAGKCACTCCRRAVVPQGVHQIQRVQCEPVAFV